MCSERRLAANRMNARRSTGPTSDEGKEIASANALSHGLTATKHMLMPGEDAAEYEAFRDEMLAEIAPVGRVQRVLAQQIIRAAWKLQRVPIAEVYLADDLERALVRFCKREGSAYEPLKPGRRLAS